MENQIQPKTYKCLRCLHSWYPRSGQVPKFCPKCRSMYYDRPRLWRVARKA